MTYAIISDIHGNIYALDAVLADAAARGADKYIFLGDYYRDFPWPNEVCARIRGISGAAVVGGNGEQYFSRDWANADRAVWPQQKQYAMLHWNLGALSPDNLQWLKNLPPNAQLRDGDGGMIYASHIMGMFYRKPRVPLMHSEPFSDRQQTAPFSHGEYLSLARAQLLEYPGMAGEMAALPPGVYLFGHNHLQFYMRQGDRLFVNPGSCGVSLDWDNRAAYTLLSHDGDRWTVDERRVDYDRERARAQLLASDYAAFAPEWTAIFARQPVGGRDYMGLFVRHLQRYAAERGEETFPVSNAMFDAAYAAFMWR